MWSSLGALALATSSHTQPTHGHSTQFKLKAGTGSKAELDLDTASHAARNRTILHVVIVAIEIKNPPFFPVSWEGGWILCGRA